MIMKTKTNYLNRHVLYPGIPDTSPNRVGTVVRMFDNRFVGEKRVENVYQIQFRDFREFWGVKLVKKNLVNF
jgi:hypothetical protein